MQEFLQACSAETRILLALSIILFAGFIMTRLTNTLNLPKVSGYILAGILIGPWGLDMIPQNMIDDMGFVSDLALAFIAFGVGKFLKKEVIVKTGGKVLFVTFCEALTAGVLVTLFSRMVFGLDLDFALILGAIATATAPASTMMTINQYKAKGEFVNTLLQIVALDDVVCLLTFSIVSAVAGASGGESVLTQEVMLPLIYNIFALLLGFFCGYFLSRLLIPARSRDNRLILAIAMLTGISGICTALDISPLLSCMVFGTSYINLTRDKKLYRQLNNFSPPIMSLFFIVSGMKLDVGALATVGVIGISYFIVRIIGKYVGTYFGCLVTGMSREVRKYMGLALVPQAGVAIGLAFLGERLLPGERGQLLLTIILSSSVLYEMAGPVCAKLALIFSGCITPEKVREADAALGEQMAVDILVESAKVHEAIRAEVQEEETGADAKSEADVEAETETGGESVFSGLETTPGDDEAGHDEIEAGGEVSLAEHMQEMEMGVENQEIFDIEKEVAPDRKEHHDKPEKHEKQEKHKKKKARRKR